MKRAYVLTGSIAAFATVLAVTTTYYSTIMSPVVIAPAAKPLPQEAAQAKPLEEKKPQPRDDRAVNMLAAPSLQEAQIAGNIKADNSAPPPPPAPAAPPVPPPPPPVAATAPQMMHAAPMKSKPMAKEEASMDMAAAPAPMRAEREVMMKDARMRRAAPGFVGGAAGGVVSNIYMPEPVPPVMYQGQDKFENFAENPVKAVAQEPVSTFSLDVDTSSYSFVRRALNGGQLPPRDAVRIEEMINYFDYNYSVPESSQTPFKPTVTVYPSPWNKDTKLVHIGIKGYDIASTEKPRSNLVFLIDVSGSMNAPDRLPLVKSALRMLLDQLQPDDTVGIVVYAGSVGTALEPTKISDKGKIVEAIERLGAGGSTAGGEGIRQAYALAKQHYDSKAVNRVILATDGDFNVGITDPNQLKGFIEQQRDSGIFLSILGVGQGNYNDALMQKLAQNGNGTAAYVDNLSEARKLLVEEANATLFTIAKDVKVQVEFNPAMVSEYRLIGYESRLLKREDFNNDKIDAGDVGSGHAVTAIYEITPAGSKSQSVDALRYGQKDGIKEKPASAAHNGEYAFLKIRYKLPNESESRLLTTPINTSQEVKDIAQASDDVRFSTAVAGFGQLLKGDTHIDHYSYDDVLSLADGARGKDSFGYRAEFVNLARLAKTESGMQQPVPLQPAPPQTIE